MSIRRRGREIALQVLYQMEWEEEDIKSALGRYLEARSDSDLGMDHPSIEFAEEILSGIKERKQEIDGIIEEHAHNWRLDRMAVVDRNILRIGVFELLFNEEIPPKVCINEAVELGKRFGSEDSGPFVNGILDSVFRRRLMQR